MQPTRSMRLWSVRTLLLVLVLACLLPGVIGAGYLFIEKYRDGRAQLEKDTTQTVRALAQTVDSELSKAQVAAEALALSRFLVTRDLAAFHGEARELLQKTGLGANIVLSDRNGQQLLNTLRTFGEPLPRHGNPEQLRRVFASGQPLISDVYFGGVTQRPVVSIDVPVLVKGQVVYDLSVGIFPAQLNKLLSSQRLPADWVAGIFDRTGTLAARTHAADQFVGQQGSPELVQRMLVAPEGALETITREGIPALTLYSRSPLSNWSVAIGIPRQPLEAELMRALSFLGVGIALLFCFSAGLAWFVGGRIGRSVRALVAHAADLGAGEAAAIPEVHFQEANEVARAMDSAANLLQQRTQALQAANDMLQAREDELAQAQGIAHLGSWYWDASTDASVVSDELRRIYGRELIPTFAEQRGTMYSPETWQQLDAAAQEALRSGTGYDLELPALRGDGTPIWINARCEVVHDASGEVVGLRGTVQDISARKQAEAALLDREFKLSAIVNHSPSVLSLKHPDGRYALANPNLQRIHHCSEEELIGKTDFNLYPAENASACRANDELALRTLERHSVEEVVPVDGQPRTFMSHIFPVLDAAGGARFICRIAVDITERKQTERALESYRNDLEARVSERTTELSRSEAEQRRLNRALRLLSDCNIALVHAKHEQQLLDHVCCLIVESGGYLMSWVGVAEHDVEKTVRPVAQYGNEEGYLDSVRISWDGGRDIGRGLTGTALRTGATQVNQNYLTSPDMMPWRAAARQRGYQSSVALPLISEYRVLGALTLYSAEPDAFTLNEVVLLEELASNVAFGLQALRARDELERYRQQLEDLVGRRTQEIAALNVELLARVKDAESANRAKSAFLATMSHEIRTPLNAVVGLAGLLADSSLDRRQRDCMDKIQSSALALRTLIDDILDFSKIEAGALRLEAAPFSLDAILRTTAVVVSVGMRDKPVEALFDVAPGIPDALVGDALRLQQILLNLTSNAVKFTEAGVIVVAVRRLAQETGQVTLQFAVRDTGIGIPSEQLDEIFEVFSQADSSTSRKYGGSGLGLAISARLARLMGGQIEVESAPRRGSEFSFTLTLALADGAPALPSDDELSDLRVLLIDDHALARDLQQQACTNFGWRVTVLDSAVAGLDELQRSAAEGRHYDLMLLDWHMPGMDGLAMLRHAQSLPEIGLPLVVLMAPIFELEQAVAASDDLYLDGVLAKPVTPSSLFEAVRRAHQGDFAGLLPPPGKTDRRLAGMRLLVAEDNDLNQQVIEQVLTRAGAEVVIAANGKAAVDALRAPALHFDAVLMDIQMPVMDGYAATRCIREELGRVDLPIIAVTAHAQPADRDKSRAAGMVGHVVKPIDVDILLDFLAVERRAAAPEAVGDHPAAAIHLPGLDVAAALRAFGGDARMYAGFLRQFISRHGGDAEEARRLFSAGDLAGAARLVHDLRGVVSVLQATELARLATATEDALRAGATARLPPLFDELQGAMCAIARSVDQLEALRADA